VVVSPSLLRALESFLSVEILFPPVDSVGVDVHLAFWAMVVCVFFLWLKQKGSTLDAQVGGVAGFLCRRRSVLAGFHCFSSDFLSQIYARPPISARHTSLSRVPRRHPLLLPVAQVTPIVGVWRVTCTRQRALCSFGARDGHAPPFSGLARWGWGLRRLIFGWVVLVTARVPHAPPSPAEFASVSSAGTVLHFLLVSSVIFRHYEDYLMAWMLDLLLFFVLGYS
jgi:hypothetical protein